MKHVAQTLAPASVCFPRNRQTGFNPVGGSKEELAGIDNSRAELGWSFSPDGKRVALVENMNDHVAVLTLASKQTEVIHPTPPWEGIHWWIDIQILQGRAHNCVRQVACEPTHELPEPRNHGENHIELLPVRRVAKSLYLRMHDVLRTHTVGRRHETRAAGANARFENQTL